MIKIAIIVSVLLTTSAVNSATFCVENSDQLEFVLSLADSNDQDDVIKIKSGVYVSPTQNSGFEYRRFFDESYALNISGGWKSTSALCDFQSYDAVDATIIDGENNVKGLSINPSDSGGNITLSNLTFINGHADPGNWGGGLDVLGAHDYVGNIKVLYSQFINNYGNNGSALKILNGNRVDVSNNLFVANETEYVEGSSFAYAITIGDRQDTGVYFTNNTVISNTGRGLYISVDVDAGILVANNILWGNGDLDVRLIIGTNYVYNNNISTPVSGLDFRANNFSEEPEFVGGFLDYTPALSSSLINRGYPPFFTPFPPIPFQNNWTLGSRDIKGNSRIQDDRVDIGAFEATAEVPIFIHGFE